MDYEVIDPYRQTTLASYRWAGSAEIDRALALLAEGRCVQRQLPAFSRAEILQRLAKLLQRDAEPLARLITREIGKTLGDSRVEIGRAINTVRCAALEARTIQGETLDSDAWPPARGKLGIVCWKPLGTVLCITPFNFPINIAVHKIAPAFAAGNSIFFKPAPQNTASARALTALCYEAGIPETVLQCAVPDIPDLEYLLRHADIAAINFTGGTAAAQAIARHTGYKKLLLELGGNDPLIVMDDADLDASVAASVNQRFGTAGQRCTAAKRFYIHQPVYDDFRHRLLRATEQLVVGDPETEDCFVGPLVNTAAADRVQQRIEQAIAAGARVLAGNRREGNIIYPTVLEDLPVDCDLVCEETFGPVIPLHRFESVDEIIPLINAGDYGLQAGVFTNRLDLARRLFEELEVGALAVNDGPGFRAEHFPFGGVKQSGVGREGVRYAMREMSYQKTLIL